jgi:hypothetical protein
MPPHYRERCRSNPPEDFEKHAEAIEKVINAATADFAPPPTVEVLYGVDSIVDVTIESAHLTDAQAAAAFEKLVGTEELRLTQDERMMTLYPPDERNRLTQEPQSA